MCKSNKRTRSELKIRPVKKIEQAVIIPTYHSTHESQSKYEMILQDLGYNPLDFKLTYKTTDNLSFTQLVTGKILDLRI